MALHDEIRRYDTNLVEADITEAGLGAHLVDPSPYSSDAPDDMEVVNDASGRTLLYVCGQTIGFMGSNGFDAFIVRFEMTENATIAENGPGEAFDIADHVLDWRGTDALFGLIPDDNHDVFAVGKTSGVNDPGFGVIFKFSGF